MLVLLKVFPGTLSEPATHLILREELRTVTSHQQPAPTQEQYFADLIDAVAAAANDDDLALLAGIDHVNAIGALIKPMTAPFPVSSTP